MTHGIGRGGMRFVALALVMVIAACSELKTQGEQCVFNDDCQDPFVCEGRRCRFQCRTDRDCPTGSLCMAGEHPLKRVCIPARESSVCGGDGQCPVGAVCLATACWWTCRDDATCAMRTAGTCQRPPAVCSVAVNAQVQRDMPREPGTGVGADAASDVAIDASADAMNDLASDISADLMDDAGADAPLDLASDFTADSATDLPLDVTADAPLDLAPDLTLDAPTDLAAEVAVDAPRDVISPPCVRDGDCSFVHASGSCVAGRCRLGACMAGFADCDTDALNGCEVTLAEDAMHCGTCDTLCRPAPGVGEARCVAGRCAVGACATGFADCNSNPVDGCETDLRSSLASCGVCGNACAAAAGTLAPVCRVGVCGYSMCVSGRGDCDADVTNGCEVDLLTSRAHCGTCGSACAPSPETTVSCVGARCVRACRAGHADCDVVSTNGCEVDTVVDPENCGGCNLRCASGEVCVAGACAAATFTAGTTAVDFAPTADTTLPSGVHRFRSVRIAAGLRVRVGAPGILEVYARGEIVVEGIIDASGGRGGDGGPSASSTCRGGNGGGGGTGTVLDGARGVETGFNGPGGGGDGDRGGSGLNALEGAGFGGVNGGGSGGPSMSPGAAGGGGGWAGGGGGGGSTGCTFCGGGGGAGTRGGFGGNGNGGGGGGTAGAGFEAYVGVAGAGGSGSFGTGGGGGGCIGPEAAMDFGVASVFRAGSGGGGGGAPNAMLTGACNVTMNVGGAGGGGGGGAVRLASATRVVVGSAGAVLANGGRGGDGARIGGGASSGAGGGGSGGAVHIWAPVVEVRGTVSAAGGAGGVSPSGTPGVGGAGGIGRVRVSVVSGHCTLNGVWSPLLSSGCATSAVSARTAVAEFPR